MVFYVSSTSVQLPVRAESVAASAACGFRPSPMDGRGALSCVAQPGRESQRWSRPERAGRRWYVKRCAASVQLPGRRTRFAASGRPQWTDAEPYRASRSRERESSQWNRPERAGRGWYVASVRLPGRGARLAASDRSQWTDAKPFREPRSRKSEGYARRCFTSPAHPSNCPGGERGLRLQTVIGGRRRSLCHASRGRGKKSQRWNRPDAPGARDT